MLDDGGKDEGGALWRINRLLEAPAHLWVDGRAFLEEHVKASDARINDDVRPAEAGFAKRNRSACAVLADCQSFNFRVRAQPVWAILGEDGASKIRVAHLRGGK